MKYKNELHDLAYKLGEYLNSDSMDNIRALWRRHNSFDSERPLIHVRGVLAFDENFNEKLLRCEDPFLRAYEKEIHKLLYRSTFGDDSILEPWLTMEASYKLKDGHRWGVPVSLGEKATEGGAVAYAPCLEDDAPFEDILVVDPYEVDEEQTTLNQEKLEEALGGALPVFVSRQGPFCGWSGDISTDLAKLRGLEQIMWDAYDRLEWLHGLAAYMRDKILENHNAVEQAGGFSLADSENQCMSYSAELPDPDYKATGVQRNKLWRFLAAQEFTTFSPDMFWEFMLQYQQPIMEKFGLSAYGCCENITGVIPYLKRIKNLRRIGVSPFADVKKCAQQIGSDYILSWRPNPSLMVATGLDEDVVRKTMREHFAIFKENKNIFDITLKDVETVNKQPDNLRLWTRIVKEEIEKAF